ncbi:MAG: TRASH domain-containing protein [Gemmataceae bacterium]
MPRLLTLAMLMFGIGALSLSLFADDKPTADENAKAKKALQDLGDFVGQWKGNCESKAGGKNTLWKETLGWSWRFSKDGEAWISLDVEGAKYLAKGNLKYLPKQKKFQFTATDVDGKEQVYLGSIVRQNLQLERKDEKTGDVHKLKMNTAAEGVRFLLTYEIQTGGKGLASTVYKVAANKEGESLAGGGKKNECIVTGGLGTIAVSFEGKTYYVCCSGCRDEFNENPKKYIDAAAKKK